jgi:hypothetical protein
MSQTFFSKLTLEEKDSRLGLLGSSKGELTVWLKGQKEKQNLKVLNFHKDRNEIILDSKDNLFPSGTRILCSFELRGMYFFSEAIFQTSLSRNCVLQFVFDVFKSEKRSSYRLLTYPVHQVTAEFPIENVEEGGKVVDLKTKTSQTGLFKNFLKMIENNEDGTRGLKLRLQDVSTNGMGIHIGDLEAKYFTRDTVFRDVVISFPEESIIIPEVKVVYVIDYIGVDRNLKKYKVGLHFPNVPIGIDEKLGGIINKLLRDGHSNKDFENFLK